MWKFKLEFEKAGFKVIVLGEDYANSMKHRRGTMSMFSPVHAAIEFECRQIDEFMNLNIQEDDYLFLADLSFPGFFANVLFHKPVKNSFVFCHATSLNNYDYFSDVVDTKFSAETTHSYMFKKVFVGSEYHKNKLFWPNIVVTYLPFPPIFTHGAYLDFNYRENDIISVSRPSKQKVTVEIEQLVEKKYGEIIRRDVRTWNEYSKFLNNSKVLLITANEETFGYQVVDAIMHGCIPIAKNNFSYPELLPEEYLYQTMDELYERLDNALSGKLKVPSLLCHDQMVDFYYRIVDEMLGE